MIRGSRSTGLRALMVAVVVVLAACGGRLSPAPQSPPSPGSLGDDLRAGIARADITPPPGLSLFGHGPEGRVAVGTPTLRARAAIARFPSGPSIMRVS